MGINVWTILIGSICIASAQACNAASEKGRRPRAAAAKAVASTSFVVLALTNGATGSSYGCAVLLALGLSWIGDILLLSRKNSYLLLGMFAFLAAHLAFSAAFIVSGASLKAFEIGLAITGIFAVLIMSWLWRHLAGIFRLAVPIYLGAIMIMVSLAAAASVRGLPATVAVGAIAFAVSDVAVARDRFVERNVASRSWGLPLYYAAQILLAASVANAA